LGDSREKKECKIVVAVKTADQRESKKLK